MEPIQLHPVRFVILDCPRRNWSDPLVRKLFERIVSLKLAGYATTYPENLIPLDKSDFYGTHVLACREEKDDLFPIAGMKLTSIERCEYFHEDFTLTSLFKSASPEDQARLQAKLAELQGSGQDALYSGCWTSDPSIRTNRPLAVMAKEMMYAFMMLETWTRKEPHWFCMASLAAKTDHFFRAMGMTEISSVFQIPEQDVLAFMAEKYSNEAMLMAEKYQRAYERRLVIAAPASDEIKRAA